MRRHRIESSSCLLKTQCYTKTLKRRLKVPRLHYDLEHAVDLLAASSFYKPKISTTDFPAAYTTKIGDKISLTLALKTDIIKRSKEVKLDANPALETLLESYKNMPMSVDRDQFDYFIQLLSIMLVKPDVSASDSLTVAFLNTLYDIDFSLMKENNTNKELVEKLVQFGLDFNNAFDKDLQKQCVDNLACNNAYNVISSYKFYIKGFLGELNLYKHFSHFFISHFITSTGRVFSLPYYLQLQGNKFAKAFLRFKKNSKLTAQGIRKMEEIIKEVLPNIHPSSFFTSRGLFDEELEVRFNKNTRGLFNQFLFNFFNDGCLTKLNAYPYESSDVTEQLLWLSANCKKQFELLYVRLLLHAGFSNDYEHLIYEKDATGSGTQIISMLIRNTHVAKSANVIYSPKFHDLYSLFGVLLMF